MCEAEVATVLQRIGSGIEQIGLSSYQLQHLRAIKECRTSALGGHVDACTSCGTVRISYNSCRNRHCPKCQGHRRELWIQKREEELLAVPYFHVVFTLPSELNTLAMHQPKLVYDALFSGAWQTLQAFGATRQLQMGMIAILHTWGQQLSLHPHLHCIVPGGGVMKNGQFKAMRCDGKFLFSVKAMSKMFRAKYVSELRSQGIKDKELFDCLFTKPWVVYAKRPFGHPQSVIEYLGRYTHKVAISNSRIKQVSEREVVFSYKDYKTGGKVKEMALSHGEFVRRFARHILPHRFVRIRHFGILSSTWKRNKLAALQAQLHIKRQAVEVRTKLHCCPYCKTPTMVTLMTFGERGPPKQYLGISQPIVSCAKS